MLLWPRCQGQCSVTWVTTFFLYEIDSYFTKSVLFFEMVKLRSCISGRVQIAPSVPFDISDDHYISSQFQTYLVWILSLGFSESGSRWLYFWSIMGIGYPLCRCVLGKGQGRGQKTEVDVPHYLPIIILLTWIILTPSLHFPCSEVQFCCHCIFCCCCISWKS